MTRDVHRRTHYRCNECSARGVGPEWESNRQGMAHSHLTGHRVSWWFDGEPEPPPYVNPELVDEIAQTIVDWTGEFDGYEAVVRRAAEAAVRELPVFYGGTK